MGCWGAENSQVFLLIFFPLYCTHIVFLATWPWSWAYLMPINAHSAGRGTYNRLQWVMAFCISAEARSPLKQPTSSETSPNHCGLCQASARNANSTLSTCDYLRLTLCLGYPEAKDEDCVEFAKTTSSAWTLRLLYSLCLHPVELCWTT